MNPEVVLAAKRQALAARKAKVPIEAIRALASLQKRPLPVLSTVTGGVVTTIIGQICRGSAGSAYDPVASALRLLRAGVDTLALFTDDQVYDRGLNDFALVARAVSAPLISQDYIFDEYQVVELRAAGAAGLVLYADLLDPGCLRALVSATQRNRMTAIVQASSAEQLAQVVPISPQAVAVAVNGMELPALSQLRHSIPPHIHVVIAESLLDFDDTNAAARLRPDAVFASPGVLDRADAVERLRQLLNPAF